MPSRPEPDHAMRLGGRTAVVVGAGTIGPGWSNGKACAAQYARDGAVVACVDFVAARAEETVARIRDEGGDAFPLCADATDAAAMAAVVEQVVSRTGRLDIMHNNVGVGFSIGAPDAIAPDAWDREIAQNLTSAYLGIRYAVPAMRAAGGGVVINTSSLLAVRFLKQPNVGYSVGKAGVEALTRACAAAYGRDGIRVNCLRIGFAETPLIEKGLEARQLSPEAREIELAKSRAKVPLRQEHTSPFDVAQTAAFLASDDARHITGVILNVDGGLEAAPL
ncbi:MAG: SDR family oxidoreductase [Sphingopyxis sp.]|nr:SDR family oxidoreductase [Sphingopyxis sp.]